MSPIIARDPASAPRPLRRDDGTRDAEIDALVSSLEADRAGAAVPEWVFTPFGDVVCSECRGRRDTFGHRPFCSRFTGVPHEWYGVERTGD